MIPEAGKVFLTNGEKFFTENMDGIYRDGAGGGDLSCLLFRDYFCMSYAPQPKKVFQQLKKIYSLIPIQVISGERQRFV